MTTLKLVLSIIQILGSLFLVAVVLLQSGRRAGLSGSISGMADTFLSKNKARTLDAKLEKATVWVAAGFVVLTMALNLL
jgi:preprotein translocase subunit SecG